MSNTDDTLLLRDSEMARLLRRHDWSKTPLGPVTGWSQPLLIAVAICLNSRFPMMIWWGRELTFIYNDAYAPMLGNRHPAALGSDARAVWHEIWGSIGPEVDAVINGGEATWNERVRLRVERYGYPEYAWFTWSCSPIPDGHGGIGGLFNICLEDTNTIMAEMEKSRLSKHLQLALDSAKMGWWHLDPVTRFATWDEQSARIFGLSGRQMAYEEILRGIHPDDRARVDSAVSSALDSKNPQPFSVEYRILRDGRERWVAANGIASFEGEGMLRHTAGLSGTASDITDRRRWQNALQESEERLRLAIAISELATFDIDLVTDAVAVNDKGREICGWPCGEALTFRKLQACFHAEDAPKVMRALDAAMKPDGKGEFEGTQRIVRTDGAVRWIKVRGQVFFENLKGAPKAVRCIGTYLDVTKSKAIEHEKEALLQAERAARTEAERVGRMKDEFLATLSHELRTPLNAIVGWTQVLQMAPPDRQRLEAGLKSIGNNSRLQAQLINDLLDMSRIISGKIHLEMKMVRLQEVLEQAVSAAMPVAATKNLRLESDIARIPAMVWGDADRLQQVLWNLLSNAIKFTPPGGRIIVALRQKAGGFEISVTDTGQGIKPEFLPHVFERFRQADASITRTHGGLGLGLAIVKQLVELHGGEIKAESPGAGRGAVFKITLPNPVAQRAESSSINVSPRPETAANPISVSPKLAGSKILIVDDNEDARAVLQQMLELTQAEVIPAASGVEALDRLHDVIPDLLICDIGMPEMDGYELIRKIRALPAAAGGQTPAIALTAFAREADRARAFTQGYQAHIAKPVDPALLFRTCADQLPARPHFG